RDLIGPEHIGIGSDYDGMWLPPVGLEDVSTYPGLLVELLRRGYSDEDVARIMGLNILRVMRDVDQVAARLRATTEPSEMIFAPANPPD
ncbi:MAG: membrane dipeptidase, partial [Planctomycetota bacterium]